MVDSQDVSMTGHGFCAPGGFPGEKDSFLEWETERNVDSFSICKPLFAHTTSFDNID